MRKGASYDKIEKPRPWRDRKTCQPGWRPMEMHPFCHLSVVSAPRESVSRDFQVAALPYDFPQKLFHLLSVKFYSVGEFFQEQ